MRYSKLAFIVAVACVVAWAGIRRLAAQDGAVRAAIEAGNKKFATGAAKGDAAMIASAYTADAEAFPPNAEVVKGRAAIEKLWKSVLDSGISAMELATTE